MVQIAPPMDLVRRDYDTDYAAHGFAAQRLYPNEELLRFMGSWYFPMPRAARAGLRILELGCGSGANLWMLAREGFDPHGLDLSGEGLKVCRQMLAHWGVQATLVQGDMTKLPYADGSLDTVLDVFSGYCFGEAGETRLLDEVARVLRPGGRFFCYTPSQRSDAFRAPGPSPRLDASTLGGIRRTTAPFFGQLYPFRFTDASGLEAKLLARGLEVTSNEAIGRTYRRGAEYFEFVSLHAWKPRPAA